MLRLRRAGKKNQPTFRVIVSEKARDTQGKYLELLGTYNPRTQPRTVQLNAERITYWISKGAQASPTVYNLLVDQKIVSTEKVKASKSKPGKKRAAQIEATKAAQAKPAEAPKPVEEKKVEEAPAT